jgi:hypothetical protein
MRETVKQAMIDGVLSAVREIAANNFNVYRKSHDDPQQAKRTSDGLIALSAAATELLGFIEALEDDGS